MGSGMNLNDMTRISGNNIKFLKEDRTPREIVEFLKEGALFRSFQHVLEKAYEKDDLAVRLTRGLEELTGEDHDSIARKVRNWLKGQNVPKNRETLFQICFVLGLDELEADHLLGAASETGIHYRNPDELIYAHSLRVGKSYGEALELKETLWASGNMEITGREKQESEPSLYTRQIRDAFEQVWSDEELLVFFKEHGDELGRLHETAYRKFLELLKRLQKPEGESGETERRYTMEEVVTGYIRMNVPQTKKVADYTLLKRLVKKYWPNESHLLNMRNRREDVSRKVMILLYLATEAFDEMEEAVDEDYFVDQWEEEDDPDTQLEIRFGKMNLFLDAYGMNPLDPGNPFDFLVLYAMKTQDGDFVSDRMQGVLNVLFEEGI